jgi:hypothetical protein
MGIAAPAWLELMDREYLRHFVPGGGSAVKLTVGDALALQAVRAGLKSIAGKHCFSWAEVDSGMVRLNLIQDFFFAVSRQIDWEGLAQRWIQRAFDDNGYKWPADGEPASLAEISAANELPPISFLTISTGGWTRISCVTATWPPTSERQCAISRATVPAPRTGSCHERSLSGYGATSGC